MKKKKSATPPTATLNRKAVYTGRRLNSAGKVWQRFELLPERSEMFFAGIRGVCIGGVYKCSAATISVRPERTDDERIDNAEWDAADALVDQHNAKKRAEKKFAESTKPALKAVIDTLRPLVKGLGYYHRRALVEYLTEATLDKKSAFKKRRR